MEHVNIGFELQKMSTHGGGDDSAVPALPHPESPMKQVADLPSHHCEEADFSSHHRENVSYHEPLSRPHRHHHHHHHKRHHHHRRQSASTTQLRLSRDLSMSSQVTHVVDLENEATESKRNASHGNNVPERMEDVPDRIEPAVTVRPKAAGDVTPIRTSTARLMAGSGSNFIEETTRPLAQSPTRTPADLSPAKDGSSELSAKPTQLDFGPAQGKETRKERHHRRKKERAPTPAGGEQIKEGEESSSHRHHHHHHHHHRHHHHRHHRHESAKDDPPTEMEEARELAVRDLDDMTAHRRDAPRKQSLIDPHMGRFSPVVPPQPQAEEVDHRSHSMFVELEELQYGAEDKLEWRETARWMKYEEDVVAEADRWGKPHVAALSFHALLELRKCIEHGTVLLDLEKDSLPSIAAAVVDNMVATGQLQSNLRNPILHALLLRHVHQSDPHESKEQPASRTSKPASFTPAHDLEAGLPKLNEYTPLGRGRASSVGSTLSSAAVSHRASAPLARQLSFQPSVLSEKSMPFSPTQGIGEVEEACHDPHIDDANTEEPQHDPVAASFTAGRMVSDDPQADPASVGSRSFTPVRRSSFSKAVNGSEDLGNRDLNALLDDEFNDLQVEESDHHLAKEERHLLSHLPADIEATTVLVGALDFLESPIIALVRLSKGRHLGHVTEVPIPVRFIFVMLGPPDYDFGGLGSTSYHEIGRSIATLMADKEVLEEIYAAEQRRDILTALDLFLDDSMVLPPGQWEDKDKLQLHNEALAQRQKMRRLRKEELPTTPTPGEDDDPLQRTGRFCGGMMKDLQRFKRRFVSDFKDAGSSQVFFTALFMYFGALAPVITFGGLLGKKTGNTIGLSEMLIGTSIGGMIWSLLSAQPLMLIGPTGPLLVFEELIYSFCDGQGLPFLQFRFWTGMWVFVILFIVVALDASYLAKQFTRFTEEVFAFLIGFIFIFEALKSVLDSFKANPLSFDYCSLEHCLPADNISEILASTPLSNLSCKAQLGYEYSSKTPKNSPNTALVNMLLVFLTFGLSYFFRYLRHSRYLSKEMRRTASDFGILITIIVTVVIARFLFSDVRLDLIKRPEFGTTDGRSLAVDPLGDNVSVGVIFGTILPAFLVAFLVFVETQVTCLIVTNPDHKLVKGQGFHWNLFIVASLIAVSSALSLPWLCGTPVPSLSHTTSLLLFKKTRAPGERPKVTGAIEQRASNLAIHALLLITLVPAITSLLKEVPVSVLFGVFLYLGIVSLLGLQFLQRIILLMVPPKHHPDDLAYVQSVRSVQMHRYTLIQLLCLGVLITVKLTPAAAGFPLIILLMVPLRKFVVTRFFSERELEALDPHETHVDDHDADSLDEYAGTHLPI